MRLLTLTAAMLTASATAFAQVATSAATVKAQPAETVVFEPGPPMMGAYTFGGAPAYATPAVQAILLQAEADSAARRANRNLLAEGRPADLPAGVDIVWDATGFFLDPPGTDPDEKTWEDALGEAAETWERFLEDSFFDVQGNPVNIVIEIEIEATGILPPDVTAAAIRFTEETSYPAIRRALLNDADTTEVALISALPTEPLTFFIDGGFYTPGVGTLQDDIAVTRAQVQALGFGDPSPDPEPDSIIFINSDPDLIFDFDLAVDDGDDGEPDGIAAVPLLLQEIGHALGFLSGADGDVPLALDLFRTGRQPIPSDSFLSDDGEPLGDIDTSASAPTDLADFASELRILEQGFAAGLATLGQFDGIDPILPFSSGVDGDGAPAGHWKAADLLGGSPIGIMTPLFEPDTEFDSGVAFSQEDLIAFSLIGWDITPQPPGEFEGITPVDNATGIGEPVRFSWTPSNFADQYLVRVSTNTNPGAGTPVYTSGILPPNVTSVSAPAGTFVPGTTYYWYVRAGNDLGFEFAWADPDTNTGYSFSVSDDILDIEPDPPILLSPSPSNFTPVTRPVTFDWNDNPVQVDIYVLEVFRGTITPDDLVLSQVIDATVNPTEFVTQPDDLEDSAAYAWRVTAINAQGSATSPVGFFFTTFVLPDAPILLAPADGATDVSLPVEFRWEAANLAAQYTLDVYEGPVDPDNNVLSQTVPDDGADAFSFTASPPDLEADITYNWTVTATNVAGSATSTTNSFTTVEGDCPGDLNGDGIVSTLDISLVLANFGTTNPQGDANNDGIVNAFDVSAVLSNVGTACP